MGPTAIKVWGNDVALSYDLIAKLKEKGLEASPLTLNDLDGNELVYLPTSDPWTLKSVLLRLVAAEIIVGIDKIIEHGAEAKIGSLKIGSSEI